MHVFPLQLGEDKWVFLLYEFRLFIFREYTIDVTLQLRRSQLSHILSTCLHEYMYKLRRSEAKCRTSNVCVSC